MRELKEEEEWGSEETDGIEGSKGVTGPGDERITGARE